MAIPTDRPVQKYDVTIRESHLDTFGHVNNATYLVLFEEARWDIITKNGYGLKEVHERQVGPTILEVSVQFRRELVNRETVTICTWLESETGKIWGLRQVIMNSGNDLACSALFKIGLFDMKARRLIAPTLEWKRAMGVE